MPAVLLCALWHLYMAVEWRVETIGRRRQNQPPPPDITLDSGCPQLSITHPVALYPAQTACYASLHITTRQTSAFRARRGPIVAPPLRHPPHHRTQPSSPSLHPSTTSRTSLTPSELRRELLVRAWEASYPPHEVNSPRCGVVKDDARLYNGGGGAPRERTGALESWAHLLENRWLEGPRRRSGAAGS